MGVVHKEEMEKLERENTALRAHAERLAEALEKKFENNLQAEFECWVDNNPNSFDSEYLNYLWEKSPEYTDITNEWEEISQALTLYRAEHPKK